MPSDAFPLSEFEKERALIGLPDDFAVPERTLIALSKGIIKQSDLLPNVASAICADHPVPVDIEPPLSTIERLGRHQVVQELASKSVANYIESVNQPAVA